MDKEIENLFLIQAENPDGFQDAANALIAQTITAIAAGDSELEQRLKAQQWALEMRLRRAKHPLVRLEIMRKILLEQIDKFRAALDSL